MQEHLLVKLSEECVEIAKDADKALLFGITDRYPDTAEALNNRQKIVNELNDLMGVVSMLVRENVLPVNWQDENKQLAKTAKIRKYMEYARDRQTLEQQGHGF